VWSVTRLQSNRIIVFPGQMERPTTFDKPKSAALGHGAKVYSTARTRCLKEALCRRTSWL
jgi:hypothetical protein